MKTFDTLVGKVVYLAGPMRGYPRFNFDAFAHARTFLRAVGIRVLCPAEADVSLGFDPGHEDGMDQTLDDGTVFSLHDSFARDFNMIATADAIVALPGWHRSSGVSIEATVGWYSGKPFYELLGMEGKGALIRLQRVEFKQPAVLLEIENETLAESFTRGWRQGPRITRETKLAGGVTMEEALMAEAIEMLIPEDKRDRYINLRLNGEERNLAAMLAERQAPDGRVKGSAFPTRSWRQK